MKIIRIFLLFGIFILFNTTAFGADYVAKKLESGQLVVVYEMKDNPIVTINTWVKTGSINEDDTNTGVAHFLEHLFFKGSENVPSGEFDKILESKGAITNAATSKDYTQFYITIPSKDFDTALKLHSDMLLRPLIPRKELEKERLVVIEEISRGLDNPTSVMYENLFKLVYSPEINNHPYKRPVIGTKEVISSISRENILEFYNKWYTPDNMITIISGDIDPDYAIKQVAQAFSRPITKNVKNSYPALNKITKPAKVNKTMDVAQGYMAIGFRAPKFEDNKEAYALDVLAVILGGSNSSILNTELKEKKQLVNSISASYSQYMDDGLFIISSTYKPAKISLVEKEIFDEIQKIKQGSITKEDIQKAKNMIKTSTYYSRESAANIANELGFFTLYFNTPKMYDKYLKRIDRVSVKDVVNAANKYLLKEQSATSTVMPEKTSYVEISDIQQMAAAAKIIPDTAKILESNKNETKYLLDNGATLIVRKNKQNSIIALDINAKGGSFLESSPGTAYLAAANAKRGTKSFSFDEMNDFLDENGIKLSLSANPDAFNISMLTTKNRLDEAFMVLNEVVNYPSFTTTEIDKTRKHYKEYVNSLKDRSLALAMDRFSGLSYKSYPYANNSEIVLPLIDKISREEIVKFYSNILDSKNLIIAITGDVDDNDMIKEFNKIFEDKGQKKVEIKEFNRTSFVPSENISKKISSDKETTWIVLGYKTPSVYDIKDIATLRVIDSVLGTGMSSRLFKSLRENQGLAYQVGTNINQYANDSSFFAYIGTNFKNEQKAIEGILAEFHKLKTEFIPNKELTEAKEKLLGNMTISIETNMDRSSLLSKYSAYGYDINFLENLKSAINNVTSSDILTFANKYFNSPYISVIVGK